MGETSTAAASGVAASGARAGTRRRALVAGIVIGSLAVGGILGGTGWGLAAATAADGLRIEYGVQPVTCEGARVGSHELDAAGAPGLRGPYVELAPGMLCTIHVQLINDGWADVAVQSVALPGMAEHAGFDLEPHAVNPNDAERIEPGPLDEAGDAVFALHGFVAPAGTTTTFEALVGWTASDLIGEDTVIGIDAPAITVSALGRTWRVESASDDRISYGLPSASDGFAIRFP